jgi:hypothetical protein
MEIWRRQRYERILVDFLFRTRCFETAQALAKATGIEVCLDIIFPLFQFLIISACDKSNEFIHSRTP